MILASGISVPHPSRFRSIFFKPHEISAVSLRPGILLSFYLELPSDCQGACLPNRPAAPQTLESRRITLRDDCQRDSPEPLDYQATSSPPGSPRPAINRGRRRDLTSPSLLVSHVPREKARTKPGEDGAETNPRLIIGLRDQVHKSRG